MKYTIPFTAILALLTLAPSPDADAGKLFGRWRGGGGCAGGNCGPAAAHSPQQQQGDNCQDGRCFIPQRPQAAYKAPERPANASIAKADRPSTKPKGCPCQDCKCDNCQCDNAETTIVDDEPNFGVDRSKISPRDTYSAKGKPITRVAAMEAIAQDKLTDDTKKWNLTVYSSDAAKRKKVVDDWASAPELKQWTSLIHLRDYDPTTQTNKLILEPMQLDRDTKFAKSDFMLSLCSPGDSNGQATYYVAYEYPGAVALAQIFQLRKVDPNYDPNKNPPLVPLPPDIKPLSPGPSPVQTNVPLAILAAGAAAVGTTLLKRKLGG